ncbi:t-SNARE syntaxin [Kluyveromyces lactis]|uniref:KLLA0F17798p n=1 Tax=Kluyveromyces lactis (strain ATCC 8585 / CBS 2359 / DSM 70799 / NBRC 1267 / NRRL Y-1140 / WM37) TaxID=284590 RepID=Q6CJL1_KLULA|nr:uncharacterized protein KLLA0_F17798g [Kluyveromyces lactis]CAG98586.1 KLLA0F17798p [Kluyveromyces lactis]|eukprot:XP_455878.1 uncharacterized protein KLLA0_F17798g [Kluyveromyces lactis]
MSVDIRNRTIEFQKRCAIISKKNKANNASVASNNSIPNKSEFQKKASEIAHEIANTAVQLGKLSQLAKRKPLLNDNPVEIMELTFLIKRRIYTIENEIMELNKLQIGTKQHKQNVMTLLNTKMKNISGNFKDVLETRQKLELENQDRLERLTHVGGSDNKDSTNNTSSLVPAGASSNIIGHGYNNVNPFISNLIDDETNNTSSSANNGLTLPANGNLLLLEEQQDQRYLQERSNAIETIESTIQEVGNLFQQLAHMVQEQGETIQRIDDNVGDIEMNIHGAQRELLKYFDNISNNRWMAVKIFAIIFVFFLLWVLVN